MKLFVFDMDGTLLDGRTIFFLGKEFGFQREVEAIIESNIHHCLKSQQIATLLDGINIADFMEVIRKIPLIPGATETIQYLKSQGHKTAIVTDSYDVVAEYFREKLRMDKAVGINLIIEDDIITGHIEMPRNCSSEEECNNPSICKKNVMEDLCKEFRISIKDTVAIGDNKVDICMIREAGIGIAFDPKLPEVEKAADRVIKQKDLREILKIFQ